jgi:hypothetical protein
MQNQSIRGQKFGLKKLRKKISGKTKFWKLYSPCDAMVIATASEIGDRGFKSHLGVRFLNFINSNIVVYNIVCIVMVCLM